MYIYIYISFSENTASYTALYPPLGEELLPNNLEAISFTNCGNDVINCFKRSRNSSLKSWNEPPLVLAYDMIDR